MDISQSFPINMAVWVYVSIVLLLFSWKNLRTYLNGGNYLYWHFTKFMLAVGISVACYALPPLLTRDAGLLILTMSLANAAIVLSMIFQAKVCETLGLFSGWFYRLIMVVVFAVSATSVYLNLTYSQIKFDRYVLSQIMHPLNGSLQSLIFMLVLIPVGYFFISNGLKLSHFLAKFKVAGFGVVYILACLISVYNYGIMRGQESLFSAALAFAAFTVILLIVILPNKAKTTIFQHIAVAGKETRDRKSTH